VTSREKGAFARNPRKDIFKTFRDEKKKKTEKTRPTRAKKGTSPTTKNSKTYGDWPNAFK